MPPRNYNPLNKNFEAFVNHMRDEFKTPGMAIAVVHCDQTWSAGYGYADLETKDPVTSQTLFYAGSTTKSFTAAIVSKLVYAEDKTRFGDIKWTTPLAELIPDDFILQDSYASQHTNFIDALCHRTGMPRHDYSWINGFSNARDLTRSLRHLPSLGEGKFRAVHHYNNVMYTAVMHATEYVTGKSFSESLRLWIWEPLGIDSTTFALEDSLKLVEKNPKINMARGYVLDEITGVPIPCDRESFPPGTGAGGNITNVLDYIKWIRAFLHPDFETHNPNGTISPKAVAEMTEGRISLPRDSRSPFTGQKSYGLGLEMSIYRGHEIIGHEGAIAGYLAGMYWIPALDWGVVIFQNSYQFSWWPVVWRLIDDFLDTPESQRYDALGAVRSMNQKTDVVSANIRAKLYPDSPNKAEVQPALNLEEYTGIYEHPAYQTLTVLILPPDDDYVREYINDGSLRLYVAPSEKSYNDLRISLHHVNGEHWFAQVTLGPGKKKSANTVKAKFEVGASGKVERMGLQLEKTITDFIWFNKK
ncbi:Hypothetical protein R9X50_00508800 [Acrodontium crateriforme]|uniref:Beta-lactamase-related domain-containing protein n=1 Tax=Acrodontium crateriforme TaxID=150365 RepID=A0AAQ3M5E7_9PEZI|nr:Hypothetical protein R9X50_00508800 [Acrodontium crateriforme]